MPEFATPFTAYLVRADEVDCNQIAFLYQCVLPKSYACAEQLGSFQTKELRGKRICRRQIVSQRRAAVKNGDALQSWRVCAAPISPHAQTKAHPWPILGRDDQQARRRP